MLASERDDEGSSQRRAPKKNRAPPEKSPAGSVLTKSRQETAKWQFSSPSCCFLPLPTAFCSPPEASLQTRGIWLETVVDELVYFCFAAYQTAKLPR
jgi:hypothetical protein